MTNFNDKFIPNIPKTFQVLELKDQQQEQTQPVKKSPLSLAARSKVINKSGSNYLSENEDYGPCSDGRNWRNCPCSRDELQRQYWIAINNNNITIQTNITNIWVNYWPSSVPQISQPFHFEIPISGGNDWADYRWITRIKDGGVGGDSSQWSRANFRNEWVAYRMIIREIENARRTLRALECGGISARGGQLGGAGYESTSQDLVASATGKLRDAIARWERGESIDEIGRVYA